MGEMGKGTVQDGSYKMAEAKIQNQSRLIRTLEIGPTLSTFGTERFINMKSPR
jgi:hypothetical protein